MRKYRITESRLRGMIQEAVRRALHEHDMNHQEDEDYLYNMSDNELRNTSAYKRAYKTMEDFAIEREPDDYFNDWQTCHDIMEYAKVPQNLAWLVLHDWQDANPDEWTDPRDMDY